MGSEREQKRRKVIKLGSVGMLNEHSKHVKIIWQCRKRFFFEPCQGLTTKGVLKGAGIQLKEQASAETPLQR